MKDFKDLLALLESWSKGYISPSAQMVMVDAMQALIEQDREIKSLRERMFELEGQLIQARMETSLEKKAPRKVRSKASKDA
jgi:hypothetical protein